MELFQDIGKPLNTLPAELPSTQEGVIVLENNVLILGVLHQIRPKSGWQAPFLHRHDHVSSFAVRCADIDETGTLKRISSPRDAEWFSPQDFVCMAPLSHNSEGSLKLDDDSLRRWHELQ